MRSRRLGGGLHGTQAGVASRVLLLLNDGGGRGGAGHRLIALHAPGFCRYLHGAAAGMGVSATETGDAIRGGGVDGSNDARALLLVELAWSGELLNRAPAWGGNWLRRARGGRWINRMHSSYPAGYLAGLDAE